MLAAETLIQSFIRWSGVSTTIANKCLASTVYLLSAQDPTNPCALNPCLNHGTCYDRRNSQSNTIGLANQETYKCFCMRGYSGRNCEIPQYACYSQPCRHGGTCMDPQQFTDIAFDYTGYKCLCPNGFSGRNCQSKSLNFLARYFQSSD